MMWVLLVLGLVGVGMGQSPFANQNDCSIACRGSRVLVEGQCRQFREGGTPQGATRFYCPCQAGYYSNEEVCYDECDDSHWSIFSYGTCVGAEDPSADDPETAQCSLRCGTRVRVWATVFIIIVFVAACLIIIFILPMCIASCVSCVTTSKERKTRKKQQAAEGAYAASYDGRTDVVAAKGGAAPASVSYNPYMYWPQSYYQGR